MPHCTPPTRISHELANALVGDIIHNSPGDISSVLSSLQKINHDKSVKEKVAYKTFRAPLSKERLSRLAGKDVAIHFDMVENTVFIGMDHEVFDEGNRRTPRQRS